MTAANDIAAAEGSLDLPLRISKHFRKGQQADQTVKEAVTKR